MLDLTNAAGVLLASPGTLGMLPQIGVLPILLVAVIAYFCGCFNGAVIVSKYILRDDVRTHGSGNAGLTNFYRTFGGPLTLVVILTDVIKAIVAILVGVAIVRNMVSNDPMLLVLAKYWAGMFCLLGHMFPCMFHFKGGKGILSGGTIAIMMDWRIALVGLPGLHLGGGLLPGGHLVRIPGPAHLPAWPHRWRPGGVEAPGQPDAHPEGHRIQIQPAP